MISEGRLRDIVKIYARTTRPGEAGEQIQGYIKLADMRGNWRQVNGQAYILSGMELSNRKGTLKTRYYPDADETMYIEIFTKPGSGEVYEVETFNHDDRDWFTLWTLRKANLKIETVFPE